MPQQRSDKNQPELFGQLKSYKPITYREVLAIVFAQPGLLPVLTQCDWKKALKRVLLTAFGCGILLALFQAPRLKTSMEGWAQWMGGQVEEVWYSDGRLHWKLAGELPYTAYYEDWRVDFKKPDSKFSAPESVGPGRKGVWLSERQGYAWWRIGNDRERMQTMVLYDKGKLFGVFNPSAAVTTKKRVQGNDLKGLAKDVFFQFLPFYCVFKGVFIDLQVLFYVLIFTAIPYLLRSPLAAGGFRSILPFYLYACLPALLIATVYRMLNVPFLDFQTIFAGAFVGYLLLIMFKIGKALRQKR